MNDIYHISTSNAMSELGIENHLKIIRRNHKTKDKRNLTKIFFWYFATLCHVPIKTCLKSVFLNFIESYLFKKLPLFHKHPIF